MASTAPSSFKLFLPISLILLLPLLLSADPESLQDFCVADYRSPVFTNGLPCKDPKTVSDSDFYYDGLTVRGVTSNFWGSSVNAANVQKFPGLNTLGISVNRVDLAVNGINPIHLHPGGTEIVIMEEGEVLVGFVSTNDTFFSRILKKKGELFVIPQGLPHFQKNVGKKRALLFTAFNSQFPRVVNIRNALFATRPEIPDDVLGKTFNITKDVVRILKDSIKKS